MDYPQRKHPRLKNYDYSQNGAYFLTICTINREKVLGTVSSPQTLTDEEQMGMGQVRLTDIGEICLRYLKSIPTVYQGVYLDSYIIMPDHVHLLLMFDNGAYSGGQGSGRPTVQKIMHGYKRLTAREAGRTLWQDSFYEHVIRSQEDLNEIRLYIRENPVKQRLTERENG